MKRVIFYLSLLALLLLPAWNVSAAKPKNPEKISGTLVCKAVPHSGINLLIHSTKGIRCQFRPKDGEAIEYYKGETGIKFGLDMSLNERETITYSVLAEQFIPGTHQLSGKYSGAGGQATFGLSAGKSNPIEKNDGSIALQPTAEKSSGVGVAAGFTYIYLEPDTP